MDCCFARYWQEQNPRYSFREAALFFSVKTRASEKVLSNSGKNETERLEWLFLRNHFLSSESKPQKPGTAGTPKAAVQNHASTPKFFSLPGQACWDLSAGSWALEG